MFVSALIDEAARVFEVSPEDLVGRRRKKRYTYPRFALFKALRERGNSLPQIGMWLGRHHTTIMWGISVAEWLIEYDKDYAEKVRYLAELRIDDLK